MRYLQAFLHRHNNLKHILFQAQYFTGILYFFLPRWINFRLCGPIEAQKFSRGRGTFCSARQILSNNFHPQERRFGRCFINTTLRTSTIKIPVITVNVESYLAASSSAHIISPYICGKREGGEEETESAGKTAFHSRYLNIVEITWQTNYQILKNLYRDYFTPLFSVWCLQHTDKLILV